MKTEFQRFEEIISDSKLLDSEMEALRGGADGINSVCDRGVTVHCSIGSDEGGEEPEN